VGARDPADGPWTVEALATAVAETIEGEAS